jgi:murein DD-endopeptidase MepM/ murein hydrolase activator NlpD
MVLERDSVETETSHAISEGAAPAEHLAPLAVDSTVPVADPVQTMGVAEPVTAGPMVQRWHHVDAPVKHSLARTFQKAVPARGDALAAVYSRMFMWDLNLRRDVQQGDRVLAVFTGDSAEEPDVPVAWYESQKLGLTLKSYRFQAPGDEWPSYWDAEGQEVAHRLVGGPLESYEQVTSLLKDRPRHQGMDFTAPTGTPLVSPKAGTVTRVNWNTAANGMCVEVRYPDGTLAKFLHLDEVKVRANQHVTARQLLATTGNTGRSTAPHLHYQLGRGSKTIDPVDYHGTIRRQLPASAMSAFQAAVREYDALLLGESVAQN